MAREASHVHLVNHGSRGGTVEGSVAFPIVRAGIHDDAFHRRCSVVALDVRRLPAVILGNSHAAPIWVQQNLGGIKAHSVGGIEASLDPISVELARLNTRHKYMPIIGGKVG